MNKKYIAFALVLVLILGIGGFFLFQEDSTPTKINQTKLPASAFNTGTQVVNTVTGTTSTNTGNALVDKNTPEEIKKVMEAQNSKDTEEAKRLAEAKANMPAISFDVSETEKASINPTDIIKSPRFASFVKEKGITFEYMKIIVNGKSTLGFSVGRNDADKFGVTNQSELISIVNAIGNGTPLAELVIAGKGKVYFDKDGYTVIKVQKMLIDEKTNIQSFEDIDINTVVSKDIFDILIGS